jgi:glycosyltransferase involved in cell wall biosynthesis
MSKALIPAKAERADQSSGSTVCPIALVSTVPEGFASRSGYPVLAEYLSKDALITANRSDPSNFGPRLLARVARRVAFSRWYLGGSAVAEWNCLRFVRRHDRSLVHLLWADNDLGFLDYYLRLRGDILCGTFHHCSDTLASVIRFPHRLRRFAAVILMSETQRSFMLDAGVAPDRIHVVLHGVDTVYFSAPRQPVAGPFTVLSVGGYRRNFMALREVCRSLQEHPEIRFRIVGPTNAKPIFAGLSSVTFESGLRDGALLEAYRSASCFCTMVENATANNALLEAMACGLPVVAERVGGIPEYVNGACSRLVAAGDSQAIAGAILDLHQSRELQLAMSQAARRRAEELDWTHVADRTREVYESIL